MRSNVESMAISIEGVLPLLRKGKRPHLVGVGSSAAYVALPRAEAYGASKAAVAYMLDTFKGKYCCKPGLPRFCENPAYGS